VVGLWILVALLGLLALLWWLPIQIALRLHQEEWTARLQGRIQIGPVSRSVTLELTRWMQRLERRTERATQTAGQLSKRRRVVSEIVSPGRLIQIAAPAIQYFRRRLRFRRLDLVVDVGGGDAFESALLAGTAWTVIGLFGSILSFLFEIPPGLYRASVQPNWQDPTLRVHLDCILHFRGGDAMTAGFLFVRQALRSAQVSTWLRMAFGRKGEGSRG
jgi:hypothetical protein